MPSKLSLKIYNNISNKHTNAINTYARYKVYNKDFHEKHRLKSKFYLFKLILASKFKKPLEKVKLPKNAVNPLCVFEDACKCQNTLYQKSNASNIVCLLDDSVASKLISDTLCSKDNNFSQKEAFAFAHTGKIVVSFCDWINQFVCENKLEKILFLSRDMEIFHKCYNKHFYKYENEYVLTSRFALQQLIATDLPDEFFDYTIKPRANKGYTIIKALEEIGLQSLVSKLKKFNLKQTDYISNKNLNLIKDLFAKNAKTIDLAYKDAIVSAKSYFKEILNGAKSVCIADLGWRGSNIYYLNHLLVKKWKLCHEVKGVMLGAVNSKFTNQLISDNLLTPFAFAYNLNKTLIKKPWENEYVFVLLLEAIFTSPKKGLVSYAKINDKFTITESNPNAISIKEFHSGITKFVDLFIKLCKNKTIKINISPLQAFDSIFKVADDHIYLSSIIGDIVDSPNQLSGFGLKASEYVSIKQIILDLGLIKQD